MSTQPANGAEPHDRPVEPTTGAAAPQHGEHTQHQQRHRMGHGLMMVVCCLPMLLVGVLVASGAVGFSAILYALLCMAMMAAMMLVMPGGHKH
jgi:hypothetical protein